MKRLLVLALLAAGCANSGATPQIIYVTPAPETDQPGITTETDVPGPADGDTGSAHVGEAVRITCDGTECLDVTVVKAAFVSKYGSGYSVDTPETKGHQFVGVYVKYRSLLSGTAYGLNDWQLYVNDEIVDSTIVLYGPKPELSFGNLPKGKSVSGWMFWEIPKTGRVVISYGASYSQAAVFEVPLRSK